MVLSPVLHSAVTVVLFGGSLSVRGLVSPNANKAPPNPSRQGSARLGSPVSGPLARCTATPSLRHALLLNPCTTFFHHSRDIAPPPSRLHFMFRQFAHSIGTMASGAQMVNPNAEVLKKGVAHSTHVNHDR